jgi:DNA-binding response OmpR family regulator
MEAKTILIIEDEAPILQGLTDVFIFHGYNVETAVSGRQGLDMAKSGNYDLIILDVMLPELDGFTICNEIRKEDREVAIIMLTAKSSDEDIISGFTLGADDYVAKPFSIRELVLRVQAVLKRGRVKHEEGRVLTIGTLRIDLKTLKGGDGTRQIEFTRREVQILQFLIENSDRPVSRGELLTKVWGYRKATSLETRTVDIHIAKLRRKIELDAKHPAILVTVRAEGYQIITDSSA